MDEMVFAPRLMEIKLTDEVVQALKRMREGKRVLKKRFSPRDLNNIGLCYWYGHIVPLDYRKAVRWYKCSAQQGYVTAEFNLYVCYDKGTGVKKNSFEALKWLKKAAKHEDSNAQDLLAECYYNGDTVRMNRRWAQYWFDKSEKSALEQKDEVTLNSLGMRYLSGTYDTPIDTEKAIDFFEKAGEMGFSLSMSFLLSIYIKRNHVEKVKYWMNKLRNCKTANKLMLERSEKTYSSFMEKEESDDQSH